MAIACLYSEKLKRDGVQHHFPRYWPFAKGICRSSVNSPHTGQWRGVSMFSLICAWKNGWVNNRDAGDLRSHITLTMTLLECWLVTHLQLSPFNGWYHICIANTLDATETVRISPNGIMMTSWMETFSALLAICAENSSVPGEFPTQRQWRGALMFSLICVWINGWINNREAGDLRRHHAHYDVIVMNEGFSNSKFIEKLSVLLQMVSICIQHHNILCGVYRIRSVTTWNRDDTLYI